MTIEDVDIPAWDPEVTVHTLYETPQVAVHENLPLNVDEDLWWTIIVQPGTTVETLLNAVTFLPDYAVFADSDVQADGTVWLDFDK